MRTPGRQEVVVLNQILADEINVGYEDLDNTDVVAVNGQPPRDMTHFVQLVESAADMVEIRTGEGSLIVLDTEEVTRRAPIILKRYHVPKDRSADLEPD